MSDIDRLIAYEHDRQHEGFHASDDAEEIARVGSQLSRSGLYGASQMIYRLSRERDEARAELLALRARVAQLKAALRKVRLLVSDDDLRDHGFLREVNDALTDAPQ